MEVGLKQHSFLTVLEAESPRSRWQQSGVLGKGRFPGVRTAPTLPYPPTVEREVISLVSLLRRALIPFTRAPPHGLILSQRPHLRTSSHWGLGCQYMNSGEEIHSVHSGGVDRGEIEWSIGNVM